MFERRAGNGQFFTSPYLGTRECSAYFRLLDESEKGGTDLLKETRDFGLMLYDIDFSNPDNIMPMFYFARMNDGVIDVPDKDSEEVLR